MFDPNDYNGITHASEARDYADRMEALEQEREERLAREMEFIEYRACTDACFENSDHTPACFASGIAKPVSDAVYGWAAAMGLKEAA